MPKYKLSNGKYIFVEDTDAQDFLNSEIGKGAELIQEGPVLNEIESPVGGFFGGEAKTNAVVGPVAAATAKQQEATNTASSSVDGSLDSPKSKNNLTKENISYVYSDGTEATRADILNSLKSLKIRLSGNISSEIYDFKNGNAYKVKEGVSEDKLIDAYLSKFKERPIEKYKENTLDEVVLTINRDFEKAKKVQKKLDFLKPTEEDKNALIAESENIFLPKEKLPKKFVRLDKFDQGEWQIQYPSGYLEYLNKAKGDLEKAKKLYIADKDKNLFSNKVENWARENESILKNTSVKGFLKEQEKAAKVIGEQRAKEIYAKQETSETINKEISANNVRMLELQSVNLEEQDDASVTTIISEYENLYKQNVALSNKFKELRTEQIDELEKLKDDSLIIDVVKRSYSVADIIPSNILATTADIVSGALKIPEWLTVSITSSITGDDPLAVKRGISNPLVGNQLANMSIVADLAKNFSNELRENTAKPIDIQEVKNMGDVGYWATDLITNQLPNTALMIFAPEIALPILGASSAGNKYSSMMDDIAYGGKKYKGWQMIAAPAIVGTAEYLTEKISMSQIKGLKNLFGKSPEALKAANRYIEDNILKGNYIKTTAGESLAEGLNTLTENVTDIYILDDKEKNIWEGVPNAVASGAFMSGIIYKAPAIGAKLLSPFAEPSIQQRLQKNLTEFSKISKELETNKNLSESSIDALKKAQVTITNNSNAIINKSLMNIDNLTDAEKGRLIDIDISLAKKINQYRDIQSDSSLSDDIKNDLLKSIEGSIYDEVSEKISIINTKGIEKSFDLDIKNLASSLESIGLENSSYEVLETDENTTSSDKFAKILYNSKPTKIKKNGEEVLLTGKELDDYVQENKNNLGGFVINEMGKKVLIINKDAAISKNFTTTGQHEFLHFLLSTTLADKQELIKEAGKTLETYLNENIKNTDQGKEFYDRLKTYKEDRDKNILTEKQFFEEVLALYSEALTRGDIILTKSITQQIVDFFRQMFQDLGLKGIKWDKASDVQNFILDYNKSYKKGRFIGSFKDLSKKQLLDKSINFSFSKSSDIKTKIEELTDRFYDGEMDDIDYEQQLGNLQKKLEVAQKEELAKPQEVKKPKKAEEDIKTDQIGDAINKIIPKGTTKKQYDTETIGKVSEKLVSGRMLDPLIKKIAAGYGIVSDNVYGKSWEDFYDAVKGVQLLKNLQKFNPETNNDFGGFVIGSQFGIRNRVKEALTQFKKENEGGFKEDVETAKGIISEEIEIEEGEVKEKTLIDPRKSRIVKDKLTEIEESIDIDPSTITTLTFKNVAEKFGGIAGAKIFDIPVKKVSDPTANLTYATKIVDGVPEYSEAGNIQNAFTNPQQAKEFIKLLPEFNIAGNEVEVSETGEIIDVSSSAKGYAIGVPNNLIKLMYDTYVDPRSSSDSKTERSRAITSPKGRSKGLTSQATVYRLKPEFTGTISNEAVTKFQDMLGITEKGKLNKYDREIGQVLKSAAKLYGSEVANIVVRDKINKLDIKTSKPKSQVLADIAAGKSTVMFSKENKQFKDQVQTLGADIIDRFSNVDNKTGKKTVNFEELHKHIQGFDKKIISEAEKRELGIYVSFTQENLKDILKSTEKITALRELLVKEQQALGYRFVYLDMLDKFSSLNESEDKIKLLKNFFADHTRSGRTGSIDNITTNKQVFEKVSELLGKNALVNLGFGFATRNKKGGKKGEKISWITHKGVGIQGALDVTLLKNKGFSDEDTLNRVLRDSNIAITTVTDFIDEQREKLKNKEITDQDYITIVKSYLRYLKIDQRGPIRKISTPGFEIKTDIEGKKIRTSDLYLEHEVSADEIVDMFLDYAKDNNPNKGKLIEKLKKAKVNIIPKYMADMLPKYKKGIPNQKGYESEPFASELKKYEDLIENYGDSSVEFEYTLRFSKNLSEEFNKIIENKTGIAYDKTISEVKAKMIADSKRNFNFFIPPSAEDFVGLLYYTLGKGKTGEKQMQFYKRTLLDPYARANQAISRDRNSLGRRFKEIKKEFKVTPKDLKNRTPDGLFTREQAVRVFIWNSIGKEIPGLSKKDVKELVDYVKSNRNLSEFATQVMMLNPGKSYTAPTDTWITGNITTDLLEVLNTSRRAMHLKQWQQNVDAIFSNENLNKLEAAYGTQYREAMKNILKRMKTGRNRTYGTDTLTGRFTDWVNGSVGAIMFLNTRSAVLQTISAVNFINFTDNNVLAAGKALVNQKQYWTDFTTLFKSEYLVDRRDGLKVNVNEADIADIAKEKGVRGALNYLLKLGFTPTQIADSFAIASGGATFYRNRIKSLVKKGMDPVAAEKLAMRDFIETAEESQQSSRPDKISQQQAGPLGRIVLAFANTPAQYARLIKKAASDLKNGRGDAKTNISKILYYGAVQNIIFNALQQALFAMTFGDEEEESEKTVNIINGTIDGIARGTGLGGAVFTVVKNTALKLYRDSEKKNPKFEDGVLEMLKISPPISSKVQKLRAAGRTMSWDMDEIKEKGASFDNPAIMAGAKVTSAMFNFPADRAVQKVQNLVDASDSELETYKRLALVGGWSAWELGIKEEEKKKEAKNKSTKRRSSVKKSVLRKTIIR
jgi:hypothetical protein